MWFKLNTTFTQSLGTLSELSNSWSITRNLTNYTTTSTVTSVAKNGTYSATFTLNSGCTYSSHSVTMGGATVSSASTASATAYKYDSSTHTITFSNFKVTGALVITAVATGASSGGAGGGEPDTPVTPTTTWYIQRASTSAPSQLKATANSNGLAFYDANDNNALRNKPINTIRFVTDSTSGTVTIGVVNKVQGTTISDTRSASFTKDTTNKEIVTVTFDTPITLTSEQMLVFEPTDEGAKRGYNFYFTGASADTNKTGKSFYTRVPKDASGAGKQWTYSNGGDLNIDVGYTG